MGIDKLVITYSIKGISKVLCNIEEDSLHRIPAKGPLIMVCNHINFLDVPVLFTHLMPRRITGFAKIETWDSPPMAYLFNLWGAIPIHRGEPDVYAIRKGIDALKAGCIFAIAPEGTRSNNGVLGQGHPGVVLLAQHSQAPLLPVAYYGHENFKSNFNQLRRTDFHIRVGRPFNIQLPETRMTHSVRQTITDEIMFQLAELLPSNYRGHYSEIDRATKDYISFIN